MARQFRPVRFFMMMAGAAFVVCGVTAFYTHRAAHGRTAEEDLEYCCMNMFLRPIAALVLLTITLSVSATSWHDDSHYVPLGPRTATISFALTQR
jgi:hypothetical protein